MVNSSKNIELVATDGSLLLITLNERGWTRVVLHHQNREVVLGSNVFEYIIDHLLAFLTEEKFLKLEWVLTLSELHHIFYGECKGEEAILKIQDANAKWIADLKLTNEQQKEWKSVLKGIKGVGVESKGSK
jgi:hypothetical protein